ncbi:MAG TPA: hypothetical protein VF974_02035 [Patescibacteria group bacterium]
MEKNEPTSPPVEPDMLDYALFVVLIALIAIGAIAVASGKFNEVWNNIAGMFR